jgi:Tol biopolymer transport system component
MRPTLVWITVIGVLGVGLLVMCGIVGWLIYSPPGNNGSLPPASVAATTPTSPAEILPTPAPSPTPALSGNGRIVFMSEDSVLWSVEPDGSNPVRIGETSHEILSLSYFNPAVEWISPDGRYVVYGNFGETGNSVLYLGQVDGSSPALTLGKIDNTLYVLSFSLDGTKVMFQDGPKVVVVDVATGQHIEKLTHTDPNHELEHSALTPDGKHLLLNGYDQNIESSFLELYDIEETLSNPRRIAEFAPENADYEEVIYDFSVSPDGNKVAFTLLGCETGRFTGSFTEKVMIVNLHEPEIQKALEMVKSDDDFYPDNPALAGSLLWSPDSRRLVLLEGGSFMCYGLSVFDTQSGQMHRLVEGRDPSAGAQIQFIGFSPDSQTLAYTLHDMASAPAQTDELHLTSWMVSVDGNRRVKVSEAYLNTYTEESSGEILLGLLPNWDRAVLKHPDSESYENPGDMYVATVDGATQVFLDEGIVVDNAIISPDGSQIVYLHMDSDNEVVELRTIRVDGTDRKTLISWNLQSDSELPSVGCPLAWLRIPQ